ncbi:hypothetical protein [Rhizobium rhizogenes]|uniref:hypothetical protein n=1 Tax=Rhizobium rhizogenes TaxID=359 RepID=UPI001572FF98|nr:hypothetical protein [Rhizobium rhizogenes]NTI74876.1 hypothetical protein [Rhizobium rhizogenes]
MTFSPNAATVYADGPFSDPYEPSKPDIRRLLAQYENAIDAYSSGAGSIAKTTRDLLYADLVHAADTTAWVYADPNADYNGIYRKSGASGSGGWTKILPLPYSFVRATSSASGTPNSILATSGYPVNESVLIFLNVLQTNTDSPVYVTFNGGAALTIKSSSLEDVDVGGLVGGSYVWGVKNGSTFQLANEDSIANLLRGYKDSAAASATSAETSADMASDFSDSAGTYVSQAETLVAQAEAGFTGFTPSGLYDFGYVYDTDTMFNRDFGSIP